MSISIKKEVLKVIKQKIKNAQKLHDEEIKVAEQNHQDNIINENLTHNRIKEQITKKHIDSIIGKLI